MDRHYPSPNKYHLTVVFLQSMVIDQRRLKALELETRQGRPLGDDFNDYYVFKHVVRAERGKVFVQLFVLPCRNEKKMRQRNRNEIFGFQGKSLVGDFSGAETRELIGAVLGTRSLVMMSDSVLFSCYCTGQGRLLFELFFWGGEVEFIWTCLCQCQFRM